MPIRAARWARQRWIKSAGEQRFNSSIGNKIINQKSKDIMENEMTIQLRNEQIVEKFCTLAESQPLATCNSIIDYLAREYSMTNMNIRHILKDAGIETSRTNKIN